LSDVEIWICNCPFPYVTNPHSNISNDNNNNKTKKCQLFLGRDMVRVNYYG